MSQHDQNIGNQNGADLLNDLNSAFASLYTNSSGATEPTVKVAYQLWADTTSGLLKIRNAANTAWVTIGTMADANLGLLPLTGGTLTGGLSGTTGSFSGAVTGASYSGGAVSGTTITGTGAISGLSLAATNGVTGASCSISGTISGVAGTFTGQLQGLGTATNDNATAGQIGEYVESVILQASAVALTTATAKTVTSISLTAGDWDVEGNVSIIPAGTTSITVIQAGISTTNNTLPTNVYQTVHRTAAIVPGVATMGYVVPVQRMSLSATTTIYLIASSTFTVSTNAAFGQIRARRIR